MTTRTFALGSAASLALAGALFAATPSVAQERGYPQNLMPSETQQTDALNALSERESTAVTRANDEAARKQAEYRKELQQHNAEVRQHNAAQGAHNAAAVDHARTVADYEAERRRYEVDVQIYELIMANLEDQRFALLPYPDQRLAFVPAVPAAELKGKLVRDRTGDVIGEVIAVEGPRVTVKLSSGQNVWVRTPRLRYDLDRHVVLTDLAVVDMRRMPVATF